MPKPPNHTRGKKGKPRGPSNYPQHSQEPREQHVCGVRKSIIEEQMEQENDLKNKFSFLDMSDLIAPVMQCAWPKFYIDFSAFQPLLQKSYIDLSMSTKPRHLIRTYVSFGMWQYYNIMILWKKILRILGDRGERFIEHLQMEAIVPDSLPVHCAIADYLDGIGSIQEDPSGLFVKFAIQGFPTDHTEFGAMGSFGRVSTDTHWIYETLPSPIVALLKIKADIEFSLAKDENKSLDWDLPAELRPLDQGATLPTANLLGWAPVERISNGHMMILEGANFTSTNFGVTNVGTIPVNGDLMRIIGYYMEKSNCQSRLEKMRPGVQGSMAQIPYWQAENLVINTPNDKDCWNETPLVNIATKPGFMWMAPIYCEHIVAKASTFRYRLKRKMQNSSGETNRDMLCYRFDKSTPPTAWLSNADTCWTWGDTRWNNACWRPLALVHENTMDNYLSELGKDAE